ncbi:MAG TPA: hypothetical protein EYP41_17150, partial [Anaerolineae bacterium]|nr:hypothetical protein [Anaerolineae bacterium]
MIKVNPFIAHDSKIIDVHFLVSPIRKQTRNTKSWLRLIVRYSVNVYKTAPASSVHFDHMVNLYHPATVDASYAHDGLGETPGMKNSAGNWDLRGHQRRILAIGEPQLAMLRQVFEEGSAPPLHTRLPLIHSQQLLSVLEKFANQPRRLGDRERPTMAEAFC